MAVVKTHSKVNKDLTQICRDNNNMVCRRDEDVYAVIAGEIANHCLIS